MRPRVGLLLALPVLMLVFLGAAGPASAARGTSGTAVSSSGLQRSSNTDDGTHWATSVPSFQHPTDKTNNEPALIIGVSVVAIVAIGGIAALIRLRARDDDADL